MIAWGKKSFVSGFIFGHQPDRRTDKHSVIAKYAGHARHVRQTSADVRQRAQTLPDIMSSRFQYTYDVVKEIKNDHWYLPATNWEKCLTGAENVRQSTEGLPDILSGTPKIIFAISAGLGKKGKRKQNNSDL